MVRHAGQMRLHKRSHFTPPVTMHTAGVLGSACCANRIEGPVTARGVRTAECRSALLRKGHPALSENTSLICATLSSHHLKEATRQPAPPPQAAALQQHEWMHPASTSGHAQPQPAKRAGTGTAPCCHHHRIAPPPNTLDRTQCNMEPQAPRGALSSHTHTL